VNIDRLRARIYWTEKRVGPLPESELLRRLSEVAEMRLWAWAAAISDLYPQQWAAATTDSRNHWPVWCAWCNTLTHMHGQVANSHGICPRCKADLVRAKDSPRAELQEAA